MAHFSRANPSPWYRHFVAEHEKLHRLGDRRAGLAAHETFAGDSLLPHVDEVRELIRACGARSILDYGSGKGMQYRPGAVALPGAEDIAEYWDVDLVHCYDPAVREHCALPRGRFDGVISTDVLEHCPEEDLGWIVDEMFRYAELFVFANACCAPARKLLPGGENAHVTVRPPEWWVGLFQEASARHAGVRWRLRAFELAGAHGWRSTVHGTA